MARRVTKEKHLSKEIISKKGILIFGIGLISLVIGFILMAQPPVDGFLSRTLAPVILVIAFLGIIPTALLIKGDKSKN